MTNNTAKKAITLYYILALSLILPLFIPLWFIVRSVWGIFYVVFLLIYSRIAVAFAVRATIMPSLWKELDAQKYAAIINAKPFRAHYSYKLNLYFAIGDYQAAYNIISSALLQHKNIQKRIYGHLLLCRVCFERGDNEGLKENLDEIDKCFKYNPKLKLPKQNKEAYEFYCAFNNADYVSCCSILEKGIDKNSKKKNREYIVIMRQYQLAVTKRMNGDIDEAILLFEKIIEKAPELILSTLAQKQLDIISGTLEEETPDKLEITENYSLEPIKKRQTAIIILSCLGCLLLIMSNVLDILARPRHENKDPEYMAKLESSIDDDYEKYQILGYLTIYSDYADKTYTNVADTVFLVKSKGKIDLHTLYKSNGKDGNYLNIKDIKVDEPYEYENIFSKKIKFVITEKVRNIPDDAPYYYEIDGYYFCVINVSDC